MSDKDRAQKYLDTREWLESEIVDLMTQYLGYEPGSFRFGLSLLADRVADRLAYQETIDTQDKRRILDILLTVYAGGKYPLNEVTLSALEALIEKIDGELETGWVGEAYTIWMKGVSDD